MREFFVSNRKKQWIGVDLDGTLAFFDPQHPNKIGPPIPLTVRKVKRRLAVGIEVRIFTARLSGHSEKVAAKIRDRIQKWSLEHIGVKLKVTNIKDHGLIEIWDDRARGVELNTGRWV